MTLLGQFVFWAWIPFVFVLFMVIPARRAVILSFVLAWMFLPMASYKVEGLPPYDKMNATSLAVLLATIVFQTQRLWQFRASWLDLPMLIYCLAPFISLQAYGSPFATSVFWSLSAFFAWGFPYFIGRLYVRSLSDLNELVRMLIVCGVIYVPFCIFEIKMSPQLHKIFYGFFQESWHTTKRFGGWRPIVFMQTGLMVGTWMTSVTVLAFWTWRRRAMRPIWGVPMGAVTFILLVTAILCKSAGATLLMVVAIATLLITYRTKHGWVLLLLIASPGIYAAGRITGILDGKWMIAGAGMVSQERADSIASRVGSEENFIRHALKRPLLGWGPGPQAMPTADERSGKAIWDALWIINCTKYGLLGLGAWLLAGVLPGWLFLKRFGATTWGDPGVTAGVALLAVLAIYQVDCLFNGMIQPIFTFAFGAITGVGLAQLRVQSRHRAGTTEPRPSFDRMNKAVLR